MTALEKALAIVGDELDKLGILSEGEEPLEGRQSSSLTDYVKVLLLVNKDDREQAKGENLESKGDEDLEALARQAVKFLNKEPKNGETDDKQEE